MKNRFGPWATLMDAGQNPQLSAFWQRRLGRLHPVSQARPTLSGGDRAGLGLAGLAICLLPTLLAAPAVAQEKNVPVSTVHVVAEMRTLPDDNLAMIGPEYDFVTVEVWRDFGPGRKWRVEKPGGVVLMDGASTLTFKRPNYAFKLPIATQGAFDTGPLLQLAQDQDALDHITKSAKVNGWVSKLREETAAGEKKIVLTVEVRSKLPAGDYSKNKWLFEGDSDTRRVYRFDAHSQRLERVEIYLRQPTGDTLILKTNRIDYDRPFDAKTFALELPKEVQWFHETAKLPDNEKYERLTPTEAAKAFFEACGKQDWAEANKFWEGGPMDDRVKQGLGGLTLIHLAEPFQSKTYASPGKGWFVPYEIKFKDGTVKKFNLAVRKDNLANRYVVDGGI